MKDNRLPVEVADMGKRIRSLEQYTRKSNVEISGVPLTANENVAAIIKDVEVVLEVDIQENQIAAAHRISSFSQDRNPSIEVQFVTRSIRDTLLMRYREKKTLMANQKIHPSIHKSSFLRAPFAR